MHKLIGTRPWQVPTCGDLGVLAFMDLEALPGLPAGLPLDWPLLSPPSWALVRDGAAIGRSVEPLLFAALCPTRSGTLTSGSANVTGLSTTLDLWVGMPIEGAGVPAGATVAGITGLSTITLSANASASGAATLTLFPFGYGYGGGATTFGVPDDRGLHTRAYDSGRGYERSTLTADTTSGSAVLSGLASTRGLWIGMPVSGAGIPASTTITQINSATSVTLSAAATATASAVALTVTGRQVGAEGADEVKSHDHGYAAQTNTFQSGANNTSPMSVSTATTASVRTALTGGPENNVKRRIVLPIIATGRAA